MVRRKGKRARETKINIENASLKGKLQKLSEIDLNTTQLSTVCFTNFRIQFVYLERLVFSNEVSLSIFLNSVLRVALQARTF